MILTNIKPLLNCASNGVYFTIFAFHVHAKSQKYGELHPKEFLIDVKLTIL